MDKLIMVLALALGMSACKKEETTQPTTPPQPTECNCVKVLIDWDSTSNSWIQDNNGIYEPMSCDSFNLDIQYFDADSLHGWFWNCQ